MIKKLIKQYEQRKLEKKYRAQGFKTLEAYNRHTDIHINKRGTTIRDWYIGYPFVYKIDDPVLSLKTDELQEWCRRNLRGKWRADWKKTIIDQPILINDGFGEEHMYFAFKTTGDFNLFRDKWAIKIEL